LGDDAEPLDASNLKSAIVPDNLDRLHESVLFLRSPNFFRSGDAVLSTFVLELESVVLWIEGNAQQMRSRSFKLRSPIRREHLGIYCIRGFAHQEMAGESVEVNLKLIVRHSLRLERAVRIGGCHGDPSCSIVERGGLD